MAVEPYIKSFRIAHITDCHVFNNSNVIASMKKVFSNLQSMKDSPGLIINTGDSILDANFKTKKAAEERWHVWKKLVAEVDIPIYSVFGNHDILIPPAFKFLSKIYNPFNDKAMAVEMLGMPGLYYSFVFNGWKFIGLNSVEKRYALENEQLEWLEKELALTKENVCIFSHVPILSAASFLYHVRKKRWWAFPRKEMHSDTFKLQQLFNRHKNVKLCLSGHVHYIDDIVFNGVQYLCGGAVCGDWWKGPLDEFPAAYTIIDLYGDGRIEREVVYY